MKFRLGWLMEAIPQETVRETARRQTRTFMLILPVRELRALAPPIYPIFKQTSLGQPMKAPIAGWLTEQVVARPAKPALLQLLTALPIKRRLRQPVQALRIP